MVDFSVDFSLTPEQEHFAPRPARSRGATWPRTTPGTTAFGVPIGRFQGLPFPLVEFATYLRAARHMCYEALWHNGHSLDHTVEANIVKWRGPKLASRTFTKPC